MKTFAGDCPFTNPSELEEAEGREVPDPYYFERGNHRDDIPVLSLEEGDQCFYFFILQVLKERADMIKGYVEYDQRCGKAMVELGRIDRDFGPKSMEDVMIDFLDTKMYNESVTDLKGSVDADQWIKNVASYAVMVNFDSPINNLNNWYVATTGNGQNDWRIVQYDHNNIADAGTAAFLCGDTCEDNLIHLPILRPTCGAVEDHPIVGRILKDDKDWETYLKYVKEFLDLLSPTFFKELRDYGHVIKDFRSKDPLAYGISADEYEDIELSEEAVDMDDLSSTYFSSPFIRTMEARRQDIQDQLDAINAGQISRIGDHGKEEMCPDWRYASSNRDSKSKSNRSNMPWLVAGSISAGVVVVSSVFAFLYVKKKKDLRGEQVSIHDSN